MKKRLLFLVVSMPVAFGLSVLGVEAMSQDASSSDLRINAQRLEKHILELAEFGKNEIKFHVFI